MKKKLLTLLSAMLVTIALFAQANKKPVIQKTVINHEEAVKIKAEKWFKEYYVEKFFKDPYSYKVLKLTSEKISVKQSLIDSVAYLTSEIEKCKLAEDERNPKTRKEYQEGYDKILAELKSDQLALNDAKEEKNKDYLSKRIAINKKYGLIYLERMKDYDLFSLYSVEKNRVLDKLQSLTPENEAKLAFYNIRIDCYSKNSIGNEILGRFQFPFNENGPISSINPESSVLHLNKE